MATYLTDFMETKIAYDDLVFEEDEAGGARAIFYRIFQFTIKGEDLHRIGPFTIKEGCIIFRDVSEKGAWHKMGTLLLKGFSQLKGPKGKPALYVHRNSGIPLYGSGSFGIVDRGTNLIEIKPITGCNIRCVYCSVDEDRRLADIVVEKDYLVEELAKLAKEKRNDDLEVHIGVQGEPLLYSPLVDLVTEVARIPGVKRISMDTNATMLTEKKANLLLLAGLTRFNVSLNALEQGLADRIAGGKYPLDHVLLIIRHLAKKPGCLLIAPVLIPGMNEGEMEKIVLFAQGLGGDVPVGIQNFLTYKQGRNPGKAWDFERFYQFLGELEKKTGKKLILSEEDFHIVKTGELEKPFRKGEKVRAEIVASGRMRGEMIAVAKGRCITVTTSKTHGNITLSIMRTKHNIFYGIAA